MQPALFRLSFLAALAGVFFAFPVYSAGSPLSDPNAIRTLVVTGGHDYETSFYTVFEGQSGLVWDHAVSNQQAFKNDITSKYDVVLLYDMSQELDEKGRANLRKFVEAGKGLVVTHHAIVSYQSWPWYREVAGGRYLLQPEGNMPASTYQHDVEMKIEAVIDHPITAGLAPFTIVDEGYKGMWISPEVKTLLKSNHPSSDGPVLWVSPYPSGRVLYLQLGHDGQAFRNPAFRELVRRSIFWTAGRLER